VTTNKGNKMSLKENVIILFASLAMAHSGVAFAATPVKKNNLEIRKIENKHKNEKKVKKPKPKVKRPSELKK
jgi:hypothetical protein